MKRDFSHIKRIVVKVGTNILSDAESIDRAFIESIAGQIQDLRAQSLQVILVSSGAIGMGAKELGIPSSVKEIPMRQACAAIGQPLLMHAYREAFKKRGIIISQVLLTSEILSNRHTFLNLRNSMDTLLKLHVVPIINENDCISTSEIGNAFGDNDRLSAYIASKMDAGMLILLTDIDALYTKNPKEHNDGQPIMSLTEITREIEEAAGSKGSVFSTGGMKTKIAAAKIAGRAGCHVVIADGRK
ncbi:MAG: glutamate 5-kinase, partial [Spirochaetales bacterium]|nr:glutamate 5-kinase [Spirochaetales bacterium]